MIHRQNALKFHFAICLVHIQDEAKQLNGLFERIYSESNPDVRRAMNKSFTESGNIN